MFIPLPTEQLYIPNRAMGCCPVLQFATLNALLCSGKYIVFACLVHLVGIDLKYGIELSVGARLFTKVATTEADAVKTLAALEKLMDKRGAQMAGGIRQHTPTKSAPLIVLLIDELHRNDCVHERPRTAQSSRRLLLRILTKGRVLGIVVAAFLQDHRKEVGALLRSD